MKKEKTAMVTIIIAIFLNIGCTTNAPTDSNPVRIEPIGKIVEVKYLAATPRSGAKMQITARDYVHSTDDVFLIMDDIVPVQKGRKIYIIHSLDGFDYVTWDGCIRKYRLNAAKR